MEGGRLLALLLLAGVAAAKGPAVDGGGDDDSAVVVEDDGANATAAAKAEDLLREIVNYGLEQGRARRGLVRSHFHTVGEAATQRPTK